MKWIVTILLLTLVWSCTKTPTHKNLLELRGTCYWEGKTDSSIYRLTIDSSSTIWFNGYISINQQDSFLLRGFEKGNNHPTQVYSVENSDTTHLGIIFMWSRGIESDTVEIKNHLDSIPTIPIKLLLLKKHLGINNASIFK